MTPNEKQIEKLFEQEEKPKTVALGEDVEDVEVVEAEPLKELDDPWDKMSPEDKELWRKSVDERMSHMTDSFDSLWAMVKELSDEVYKGRNIKVKKAIEANKSDMKIPEGTQLHGTTQNINYFCMVKDGAFYVGAKRYESLSAAAEGVSGCRRSGWSFWKMPDGKSVKETYKGA